MLALVPLRVWAALALFVALMGLTYYAYDWAYDRGVAAEHLLREGDRLQHEAALQKAKDQGVKDAKELQDKADTDRATAAEQKRLDGIAISNLSISLRARAARPTGGADVPSVASSGPGGCRATGAGLYREDGEFLAGESATSNRRATALRQCISAYTRAREKSLNFQP